jgi:ADP-dependent NAD(P)H-hydrate dehydratase / NAD(P)H-hydrate epimerase
MEPVVTPEQMGEADRRTIAAGTPVEVLIERAGRAVAWHVRRTLGGTYGRRAVVVCGKGNNGRDGLVAARVLARWGMGVTTFVLGDGVHREQFARALAPADVAIDAMFGTGFRGALADDAAWIAARLEEWPGATIAVDIPSGVDGLTGVVRGAACHAHSTITFAACKPGIVFEPGRSYSGDVVVADIGIDARAGRDDDEPELAVADAADVAGWIPRRSPDAHKWQSGVMVVGGSAGMAGAPMFVSHAAMRAGAGIVWCGVPGAAAAEAASGSEVITRALPATRGGFLAATAADSVLATISRFGALALGPGLGIDPEVKLAVGALVAACRAPMVLDADGLNALAGDFASLHSRATLGAVTVLTPHEGEYARLMGQSIGGDRIAAARALAERSRAVVLLKGPGTVIAAPGNDEPVLLNPTGNAGLATAGSGDVLTGVIAGLLARGMTAFAAAAAGAWVHGRAADRLAATVGEGFVAADLVAAIPPTLLALTADAADTE